MKMKRKAEESEASAPNGQRKKLATEVKPISSDFSKDLFASETRNRFTKEYASSQPYRHGVVSRLIDDNLLRSVRSEILENIVFTPKETDIYKIHQSGDLANLEGLSDAELSKLPSLQQLRNALYSPDFRQWLSAVTGAGALSGTKTDMAVNVYVPGCHLLCHDDVIGTRRVSYILYLTDPDVPWKAEWGGALRLYPTAEVVGEAGNIVNVPSAQWSKVIPPAWNQLSFFAIQPGLSFHDVEEVYTRSAGDSTEDGGRFRMAISGWFHIPEEHEEGYEPGLEKKLTEQSSLHQLEGNSDAFDRPQPMWHDPEMLQNKQKGHEDDHQESTEELSEADLEFLLRFITPQYLTPDTVEELNEDFSETSMLQLSQFLNANFAARLKSWLEDEEIIDSQISRFLTSKPPHKHRYQYLLNQPSLADGISSNDSGNPFDLVLNELLPSMSFRKWLSLLTGLTLRRTAVLARHFRRGLDYELAQRYTGENPQLEYSLCITPTSGWVPDDDTADVNAQSKGSNQQPAADVEETNPGGYELYMAGDDDDSDNDSDAGSDHGVPIPAKLQSHTGAGDRKSSSRGKADPAIYKSATDDEDDGIIASNPPDWNVLRIVLRDKGTMRFVKYVSKSAPGDRWDFVGAVEVDEDDVIDESNDE